MQGYYKLRKRALEILNTYLPKGLYYHSVNHTLDVLKTCDKYIKRLDLPAEDAKLLRIGALTHDIGFIVSTQNHEEHGAAITADLMISYGFGKKQIEVVKGLIMATKVPQSPKTELEKVLCDCDLDYLGRNDFYEIGNLLFKELKYLSVVKTKSEWNQLQIGFLEKHHFHTEFAIKNRQPKKEKRISELKLLFV